MRRVTADSSSSAIRRSRPPQRGHRANPARRAECPLVCRLQRRVHVGESAVLLSAHDHGLRQSLPADLRRAVDDREKFAFTVFERAFKEFGLPTAIRTDNGVPFASGHALYGLRKLSVWWLRLGLQIERIKPGHPEQNGRHERMHLTLKKEATKPAVANVLQQQARFDTFVARYNQETPHQALGMKVPADFLR